MSKGQRKRALLALGLLAPQPVLLADEPFDEAYMDGGLALEHTLGSQPGPGRNNAPPHPDLFPENNPVLHPPVAGRIGLWSKTDSTSYFKGYVVATK